MFIQVGKETASSSKDQILKQEMPLAFKRVEESSIFLVEASQILRRDPLSSEARKKLIDGARGILYSSCEAFMHSTKISKLTFSISAVMYMYHALYCCRFQFVIKV